ncbi:hypothetical protein O7626_41145 [Micromonospora sp. WMMD1102]|uniref:hypothetical protein n=1 Tax=Micromonospora sp. WMMD1102 TaxID=3016105 RepID=UPI002414DEDD|nr:hypothetical protein [Micromonospora sp. WMMD1102]MDG4784369.1 hypothetical protein [Micromonospora sp. WMMD1102]MDG4784443.1 hypothetical protein [Micromonospora sp. WMMD1102]MDG4792212.1 hypothetical protein [Micromonospora sp. WMMD1102]
MTGLRPGDLLRIDRRASVQFSGDRALTFRVLRVDRKPTYHGWCWLSGYVLDGHGEAVERREVFVQLAGLCRLATPAPVQARPAVPRSARKPTPRPAARPPTTSARDQAAVHRAWSYPQRGSLV